MKILVPVKRVVDYNVKVRVKADQTGVDIANVKMSMNPFDEIAVGDSAHLVRTLRPEDIHLFAVMSGDVNPTHVDPEFARSSQFREVVGHSMWRFTPSIKRTVGRFTWKS